MSIDFMKMKDSNWTVINPSFFLSGFVYMVGAFKRHVLMVWYIEGQCIEVIERSGVGYHLMMGRFLIAKALLKVAKVAMQWNSVNNEI